MFVVDTHLDLAYNWVRGRDITRPASEQPVVEGETATVGLPDLRRAGVGFVCATIFALPETPSGPGYRTADEAQVAGWEQLQYYLRLLKAGEIDLITEPSEVPVKGCCGGAGESVPVVLLLEGADPLRTPADLAMWFDAGLRVVGMAWKGTRYCGGTGVPGPLTALGRELVVEMDRLGMIHDVSHLAEESFWELMDLARGPVFASHSNCRAFVPTDRQLSDEMIMALAKRGGVIGINYFDKFLLEPGVFKTRRATLDDVVRHIDHICQLTGNPLHVGIGTDMDGGLGRENIPVEMETAADLPKLGEALRRFGYTDEGIEAVLGGNMARFFRERLPGYRRAGG